MGSNHRPGAKKESADRRRVEQECMRSNMTQTNTAEIIVPAEIGHPYRNSEQPKKQSIASRAMGISYELAVAGRDDFHDLSRRIEDLLIDTGYEDLRHYDLERPIGDRFTGICCTYLNHGNAVVLLERITFPCSYSVLHDRLHMGELDFFMFYFMESAKCIRTNLDLFGIGNFLTTREHEEFLENKTWADIRMAYGHELEYEESGIVSGRRLVRAVNYARER